MKKTGFISATILIVAISAFVFLHRDSGPATSAAKEVAVSGQTNSQSPAIAQNRSAAVGWSVADDPRQAVHDAVASMRAHLNGKQPTFALASFTVGYDRVATIAALRSELGPDVRIHGCTSVNGVMTNEGLHRGNVGAVGVLGVANEDVKFGVGDVDPDKFPSLEEAGKSCIQQAIADAGHQPGDRPNLILFTASMRRGGEMKMLDGIADVVGSDVPVLGGNAGDEKFDRTWTQFTQKNMYHEGLVLTVVYSKKKVGWAFESGFHITDKTGIVTKSDGQTLYEIDHRPALDVYNEWTNGALMDYINKKGHYDIAGFTAQYPLCVVMHGPSGQVGYMTAHPVPKEADMGPKTVPVYALVEQGSRIQLFNGTWQTLLNRAELAPANSLIRGDISRDNGMFGALFFCSGAFYCIPADERPKIPMIVDNAMGDIPFLGIFTVGEQGYIPGVRNVSANLVESMVTVGND
ncbi:MAG TPA: FIST N-terminal domain-containing protein [Tepidisphaeraceae bacterium]|jgi:hypothetical protein|nr:FIST N-terminal domain-containing protein [Tepidisphaeraceae bacterium]